MPKPLKELYDDLRIERGHETRGAQTPEDPFVLKLANLLLAYGVEARASDIHVEPTAVGARVRYRIDGLLHPMLEVPHEISEPLIRSVKLKASMTADAVGRSKPQDGRLDFLINSRTLDVRISSFPTLFGDVLALRLFDRGAPLLRLEELGLAHTPLEQLERLIHRPNGMLLVTGPAGSGKTTTLYAALNAIRSPQVKVVTLEDPVEYQMEGVDQGQINQAVGLTFASGLRAILRQDANVILVGEIRDKETAEIAVRAALTGHLVFSTMHTRNALGAATRLIEMGIEPHLILASITGVVAQRLVRRLCPQCKAADPAAAETIRRLWAQETGEPPPDAKTLCHSAGCPSCNATGYQGRAGIFELLVMTDEFKQLILRRATGQLARRAEDPRILRTMRQDGLEKAAQGLTTIEEVLRVTGEVEDV
jgi:type II secretory ATPase GspE/PulE/Tfp pilus assembly ATPase PilB-like protein